MNVKLGLKFLARMVLGSACASAAEAGALQPLEVFKRCYIRMVRQVPVENDALFLAVKNGVKAADEACAELFDRARLNANGLLQNRESGEAKAILRTFHDLHRSWFQSKTNAFTAASLLIRDMEEAPLYFTRAALQQDVQFRSVVTHDSGLRGVRDQRTYPNEGNPFLAQRLVRYRSEFAYADETDLIVAYNHTSLNGMNFVSGGDRALRRPAAAITEVGDLVGVRPSVNLSFPSFRAVRGTAEVDESIRKIMAPFAANAHFGGGVIGSQGFLSANANLTNGQLPNEYTMINRRLTARVFEDLLCHQLPTLSDEDVAGEVNTASPHTFQRTSSCMRCHSSIDGMGFGFRNLFIWTSARNPNVDGQNVGLNVSGFAALAPKSGAATFAVQPPRGRLHYRELVTGVRRSANFNSLAELGTRIADSQDLYVCAAKRYYKFLTGVDVDLTRAATLELDKLHQDQVMKLAAEFRTHQSVRSLLKQIFASRVFQTGNYMTEKEK